MEKNFFDRALGITFLEILIALIILSILFGISLNGLKHFSARHEAEFIRLRLLRLLEFAHQEALSLHQAVIFCKSKNDLNCGGEWLDGQLIFVNENANGAVSDKHQILAVNHSKIPGILKWRSFPFYRDYLLFNSNGLSDNGTFWFCPFNHHQPFWAVFLNKTGKTRSVFPNKKGEIQDEKGGFLKC